MATAKEIKIIPITAASANALVKKVHYSGKVVPNSKIHLGVLFNGKLEGAMQFGPSMDKSKAQTLVNGTKWNGFLELNRMAFSEALPKNSESRAISVAMRIIKKNYPGIDWIVSYADATQCGDGTIYRASGFVLTGIKKNTTMLLMPDGRIIADKTLNNSNYIKAGQSAGFWKRNGAKPLVGFQLRYIYFLNNDARKRLSVKEIPFSKIKELGADMYRGQKRAVSKDIVAPGFQSGEGGENPTTALQSSKGAIDAKEEKRS